MAIKEELKAFFKGDIADDDATLTTYSHDASLFEVRPSTVLFPKDSLDIQNLVAFVNKKKDEGIAISVTPRAAGTCMSGGPLSESIVLDVSKYMTGTLSVDAEKGEAVVLPGTFYRDFEKATLAKGLLMPAYTASKNLCAIGGMIGNNSGGEKTLSYGKIEDYVKALKVIFADGKEYVVRPLSKTELDLKIAQGDYEGNLYKEIYELVVKNQDLLKKAKPNVSKNSAGYYLWNVWDGNIFNLCKLIVGSQGTLGIVTEATLKLVPVKSMSKLLVVFLSDLKPVSQVVNEILPFKPETLESYDDHTMKLALKFFPDLLRTMHAKNFFKLMWGFLPEVRMVLTGGVPKLIILAEFAGNSEQEIDATISEVQKRISHFGLPMRVTRDASDASKYWTIRRESFNLLRKHVKGRRTAPFIDDIIVRPEHLPEFMPKLTKILDDNGLLYTVAGHAGDGNFHIIPLMDMRDAKNSKLIVDVSKQVYELVVQYGGSITAEHNDGIIRTPYLTLMYGEEVVRLFKETKDIFDPQRIFNPGKKVGDTVDYLTKHLVRA